MKTLQSFRASADRRELRHDRRYVAPALRLEIEGRQLTSVNWSLGGFLVRSELALDVGATVKGTLRVAGSDGFTFIASLVRKDARSQDLGFQFEELTPLALERWNHASTPPLRRHR